MKPISKISGLLLLSSLAFASCEEPEVTQNELSVEPSSMISFEATDNEDVILSVTTDAGEWDFTAPVWVTATPEGDKLLVNVKDNATGKTRNGRIEFTAGTAEAVKVNVLQKAAAPEEDALSVTPSEPIEFAASGNEPVVLTVETNVADWTFEKPEWVTAEKNADGNQLIVSVQDNETEETLSGFLIITAGEATPVEIPVSQQQENASSEKVSGNFLDESGERNVQKIGLKPEVIELNVKFEIDNSFDEDLAAEIVIDDSYLETYNFTNKTECRMIPVSKVTLPADSRIVIRAGETSSELVKVTVDATDLEFAYNTDYLLPLMLNLDDDRVSMVGTSKRVNYVMNKGTLRDVRTCYFCCVNDTNPLNALAYTLEDGTPFFDAVVLFSANLNYDEENNAPMLYYNNQVKFLLDRSDEFLQPLREKGIKVYLGLLPNHQGVGLCNLSDEGAKYLADQVVEAMRKYKLDGVELDEEYAKYSENPRSGKYFSDISALSAMNLAYWIDKKMEEEIPWKTDICAYQYDALTTLGPAYIDGEYVPCETFIDFGVGDYGFSTEPNQGLPMSGCCAASFECDLGTGFTINSVQDAINVKDSGYGWIMWYALHPEEGGGMAPNAWRGVGPMNYVAEGIYGSTLKIGKTYRGWNGGFSSEE